MKSRFAVPLFLAPLLALFVATLMTPAAFAQQRGEEHHDNVHANQGHIPHLT